MIDSMQNKVDAVSFASGRLARRNASPWITIIRQGVSEDCYADRATSSLDGWATILKPSSEQPSI